MDSRLVVVRRTLYRLYGLQAPLSIAIFRHVKPIYIIGVRQRCDPEGTEFRVRAPASELKKKISIRTFRSEFIIRNF